MEYLLFAILFALVFLAGWKCCFHWHTRRAAPPTPEQRAWCSAKMRQGRERASQFYNAVFCSGIEVGKRLNLQ